jgi:predicted nuclease of predicted toxin-antitoxin system
LARWLEQAGHEAKHVEEVGLREAEDAPIWRYALANQAVILTKDEDFAGRAKQSRNSPKVVWLQIGNCSNRALHAWLEPLLPAIVRQLEQGDRLLEIH